MNESISRILERLIQSYNTAMQTDRPLLLPREILRFLQIIQRIKKKRKVYNENKEISMFPNTDSPTAINQDDAPKRLGVMTEQVLFRLSLMGISLFSHKENMIHMNEYIWIHWCVVAQTTYEKTKAQSFIHNDGALATRKNTIEW